MTGESRDYDDVDLRALDLPVDLLRLERWLRQPHVVRWWGPPDQHFAAVAQELWDTHAVITLSGRPVGYLCWQRLSPSARQAAGLADLPDALVDIGILIGEPELRGHGVGPRALAVLLARLRREGVDIAGLGTSTSNRAAISAFAKAGFRAFRDFEDPDFGPCTYMVARLQDAVEQSVAAVDAARRR